jgi:bifunctional non-homologous end joining protein LigD
MLATLVDRPFDQRGWLYEIKWDGYRCLAFLKDGRADLKSRNNKSFNEKFYPIYRAVQKLDLNCVLDGEIVVSDENGVSNFGQLQNWRSVADGALRFYVFDLLWLNGQSLLKIPLKERKESLQRVLQENPIVKISQAFETGGIEFFEAAKKMGLEGIMAKKSDSDYEPGIRSKDWLKIKIGRRQEVVIGGFTRNEGTNKVFSSLLVGLYKKGKLVYSGKIGTGFSDPLQKQMIKQFKPLTRKTSPFETDPDLNKPSRFRPDPPHAKATWLKPELVCEVSFTELTQDGLMRHPSFAGMRVDKRASEVGEDRPEHLNKILKTSSILHTKKMINQGAKKERKSLLNPRDELQVRKINGQELKFNHLSKLFWPKDNITKRDLLNYYYQVAPFMLPYLKDRPQSLNRYPNGIDGPGFYQKDVKGKVPSWIETFPYHSQGDEKDKSFLVCTDEASLLYIASLGCIEMNPWSSRVKSPDHPDWCVIDLDPSRDGQFEQVIEAAKVTRGILDHAGISGYCKTSGSTGLHIYIPLGAKYDYETSKEFARLIVTLVNRELPKTTSIERSTKDRKGKIYLDFLQNRPQATLASAYSVRPKPGATVSMPLHWEELKKGLSMGDFTLANAVQRIKEQGDLFKPVLGKGIQIQKAVHTLEKMKS